MREIIKIAATEGRLHLHESGGAINRRDPARARAVWVRSSWGWEGARVVGRGEAWNEGGCKQGTEKGGRTGKRAGLEQEVGEGQRYLHGRAGD